MKMTKLEKKFVNSKRHAERNLKLLEQLFMQFDSSDIKKVLEIGCGVGTVASYLSDKYEMNIVATDADLEQIELAKRHYREHENLQFVVADATNLPFENAEFEMVMSLNVFHHIKNWRRVLSEVNRLLKPNGYFVFHDLAYSKIARIVFRPIAKNYDLYTIGDVVQASKTNALSIVYKKEPSGMILTIHSIVFQKG
jgi:ubiquinone/menaquinone biosynthesis C-methylase UbiE